MAAADYFRVFVESFRQFVQERGNVALEHRLLRDAHYPFEINDDAFVSLFRLPQDMVLSIADTIRRRFHGQRTSYTPLERQVLIALMVLGQGSYQRPAGRDWGLAVSQPTVSRCFRRVTTAINSVMLERWIKMPMSQEDRHAARRKFEDATQPFPGAIGAIDCTHVAIIRPTIHEEAYKNHHDFHSLDVQVTCDPDLIVLDVNARFPGARHDYYIWTASMTRVLMSTLYQRGERHTWLLGDAGYALEPWLMTPLPHAAPNTPAFRYTMAHYKARNVVERCFGVLKSTWRILSSQRVVTYDPAFAGLIVYTCCILHNMRRSANLEDFEEQVEFPNRTKRSSRALTTRKATDMGPTGVSS